MKEETAKELIKKTLQAPFDKENFGELVSNTLNYAKDASFAHSGNLIRDAFAAYISRFKRIAKYEDKEGKVIDTLIVHLKKETSLERARSMQRNFVADYLKRGRGYEKDAALVAFVAPNGKDWRFSFVKMEYRYDEQQVKVKEDLTPARRSSFLVGKDENCHTAQSCLLPLLQADGHPKLQDIEEAFSIEQVTKEFFEKYKALFFRLKETLDVVLKDNAQIQNHFQSKGIDATNFAKKLLGQVVFLYFLQKKGWFGVQMGKQWGEGSKNFLRDRFEHAKSEGDRFEHEKSKGNNFFSSVLEPLFYEALSTERSDDYYSRFECRIPFLNGGLFEPINNYDWVNLGLPLPNDLFSNKKKTAEGDTGDGILDVFDRYNFTVKEDEPLEKEVAVDPEMLGKVFENLLEIKDRKSKGTYYTPREVVHYMCKESLIAYLAKTMQGKVSEADSRILVERGEATTAYEKQVQNAKQETRTYTHKLPESVRRHAQVIDKALARIRVCDPAAGSGAFVVGMMHEIISARAALNPLKEDELYALKRHAIEECLYGVDIDAGAVEIAKLRLWLSLVVDEEERETVQPLPNLDYKITKGDALLSIQRDLWNNDTLEDLASEQQSLFGETSAKKKEEHRGKIDQLITEVGGAARTFYIELYFPEPFLSQSGFDIVIGNPPYVQLQKEGGRLGKKYEKAGYQTFARTGDIYQLFYERGHKLLTSTGHLCFITSNKWMRAGYGQKLRNYFAERTQPLQLIDLGDGVFTSTVDSNILLFGKEPMPKAELRVATTANKKEIGNLSPEKLTPLSLPKKDENWTILSPTEAALKQKIDDIGTPLKNWDLYIYRGVTTGYNEAFIIDTATKERLCQEDPKSANIIKPVLRGRDIKRYHADWKGLWLIDTHNGYKSTSGKVPAIDIQHYPAVKVHLDRHWEKVEKRLDQGSTPYNLRSCAYYPEFEKEKVVYASMTGSPPFLYDSRGYYTNDKCFIVTGESLKYLCGFFNSAIAIHWIKENCPKLGKDGRELRKIFFEKLPVPPVTDANRVLVEEIEAAADAIHAAKEADPKTNTHTHEQRIDALVYQLYDLTKEEIALVEQKHNRS